MKIREGRKRLSKTFASRGCPCIAVVELVETTKFSVIVISTASKTTTIYTFGTVPNGIIKINFMHYQLKFEIPTN